MSLKCEPASEPLHISVKYPNPSPRFPKHWTRNPKPVILKPIPKPTPCTLNPKPGRSRGGKARNPYTLHLYTLQPYTLELYTLQPYTFNTLHLTTLNPKPYTLHLYTLQPTPYIATLYNPTPFTLYTLQPYTLNTLHLTTLHS